MKIEISKRRMKRLERADKVAREISYLFGKVPAIDCRDTISKKLMRLLALWIEVGTNDTFTRPE